MTDSCNTISDDEIVAMIFRLARSGRFLRVGHLLQEAQEIYPAESPERIKVCVKRLGEILWEADYQGLASDYRRHRRPSAEGLLRAANPSDV